MVMNKSSYLFRFTQLIRTKSTPVKHLRSQKKKTLHLSNIRDPREKNTLHRTNIRDLKLFHVKNSHVKTGKKYVKSEPETPFPILLLVSIDKYKCRAEVSLLHQFYHGTISHS